MIPESQQGCPRKDAQIIQIRKAVMIQNGENLSQHSILPYSDLFLNMTLRAEQYSEMSSKLR
ncbi:hypothetical protein DASB73_043290 [Starmerella bacillaris]|uniref:Uncharacterized protein n=1 Tax=Starmerella bacillaris TaxID=1247836 RepID=A0AAV5RRV2_STABA|nr:hypothetical protein DASB73_043290 [Starmerella bacillaris]